MKAYKFDFNKGISKPNKSSVDKGDVTFEEKVIKQNYNDMGVVSSVGYV